MNPPNFFHLDVRNRMTRSVKESTKALSNFQLIYLIIHNQIFQIYSNFEIKNIHK